MMLVTVKCEVLQCLHLVTGWCGVTYCGQ